MTEPRLEQGQALQLAGLRQWYSYVRAMEIPQLWDKFGPSFGKIPHQVGFVAYGVISDMIEGGEGFDYMAAAEVSSTEGMLPGFEALSIPARSYAVFPHAGPVATLRETMDFAWNDWLPSHGHTIAKTPAGATEYLERYDEDFDPAKPGHVELWVPITT